MNGEKQSRPRKLNHGNRPKPRKRGHIKSLFNIKENTPQCEPTSAETNQSSSPSNVLISGDTQRAKNRYYEAAKLLEGAVRGRGEKWGSFDVAELRGEPEDMNDSVFKDKIDKALDLRKHQIKDQRSWGKCKHVMHCVFTAMSPFAKTFLAIASQTQSVVHI
jgi:hypothetical protein